MKTLILLLVFITSCKSAPVTSFQDKFNKLQGGQTTTEVIELLGQPNERSLKDGVERWLYIQENQSRKVEFKDQKVISFGHNEAESSKQGQAATFPPRSRALGEKCSEDVECITDNCHFSKCAGKTNCFVPVGKRCTISSDCCDSQCENQICVKVR